jgi:LPXTG-motif cell wall-anchored protein
VNKQLVSNANSVLGYSDSGCSTFVGFAADGGTDWTYSAADSVACLVVTLGGSGTGTGQINVIDASFDGAFWNFTAFDGTVSGGGGSSSSSNPGCEVAGKPCKVRPWPWPVAHTDHINVSWEALIPAEAGTGGVTSYRVESSPAGGTCILRLSEVPAGESLPTNCDITGLDPDTDYTFTVYASSAYGEGPGRSTQEPVQLLAAATPAVTVPAITPETPAPTLPATGQQTVLVGAAVLLIALGAFTTLSARRRRDLSQMAQSIRHP